MSIGLGHYLSVAAILFHPLSPLRAGIPRWSRDRILMQI